MTYYADLATIALLAIVMLLAIAAPASADDALSPSPAPTPTVTQIPIRTPSAEFVAWALGWRAADVRARRGLGRWRAAFGYPPVARVTAAPARGASRATWLAAARQWRSQTRSRRVAIARLRDRAIHPGGSGAARWLPLAIHSGWPRAELWTLSRIVLAESGGRVRAYNASSRCSGLLQLAPGHWRGKFDPYDPQRNLAYGLKLWHSSGWRPWTTY